MEAEFNNVCIQNESDFKTFILKYMWMNPQFEKEESLHSAILERILNYLRSTKQIDVSREEFLQYFFMLRDLAIQGRLRFNKETVNAIASRLSADEPDFKTIRQMMYTFDAQEYVRSGMMSIPDNGSYLQIGFSVLMRTIDYICWSKSKLPIMTTEECKNPTVDFYMSLLDKSFTDVSEGKTVSTGITVEKNVHSPFQYKLYHFKRQEITSEQNVRLLNRMFYIHMLMSIPLFPDPDYLGLIVPGMKISEKELVDLPIDFPSSQSKFIQKHNSSVIAVKLSEGLKQLCPGIESADYSNTDVWFNKTQSVIDTLFTEGVPNGRNQYTILRMKALVLSLLRDTYACKIQQRELLQPWGNFLVKQDDKHYTPVGTHMIILSMLQNVTEDTVQQTYNTCCKLFAHAFVSKYAYRQLYSHDSLYVVRSKSILLEQGAVSSDEIYTKLEKPYVDQLLPLGSAVDVISKTMYDKESLYKTNFVYKDDKEKEVYYWPVPPEQRNMASLGILVQGASFGTFTRALLEELQKDESEESKQTKQQILLLLQKHASDKMYYTKDMLINLLVQYCYENPNISNVTYIDSFMNGSMDTNSISSLIASHLKPVQLEYASERSVAGSDVVSLYKQQRPHDNDVASVLRQEFALMPVYNSLHRDTMISHPVSMVNRMSVKQILMLTRKFNHQLLLLLKPEFINGESDMIGGGISDDEWNNVTVDELKDVSVFERDDLVTFIKRELYRLSLTQTDVDINVEQVRNFIACVKELENTESGDSRTLIEKLKEDGMDIVAILDVMYINRNYLKSLVTTTINETQTYVEGILPHIRPTFNDV